MAQTVAQTVAETVPGLNCGHDQGQGQSGGGVGDLVAVRKSQRRKVWAAKCSKGVPLMIHNHNWCVLAPIFKWHFNLCVAFLSSPLHYCTVDDGFN